MQQAGEEKFIEEELLKDTDVSVENFWTGFEKSLDELVPKNRDLIKIRENLQKKITINGKVVFYLLEN